MVSLLPRLVFGGALRRPPLYLLSGPFVDFAKSQQLISSPHMRALACPTCWELHDWLLGHSGATIGHLWTDFAAGNTHCAYLSIP